MTEFNLLLRTQRHRAVKQRVHTADHGDLFHLIGDFLQSFQSLRRTNRGLSSNRHQIGIATDIGTPASPIAATRSRCQDKISAQVSQNPTAERLSAVNASREAAIEIDAGAGPVDLETIFAEQYRPITRAIGSVLQDPGRAEELAVEVFLKWSMNRGAHGSGAKAWLYRTASRMALDELRRQGRRQRYETLVSASSASPNAEAMISVKERQRRVRSVLAAMSLPKAQLLFLRSQGLDYAELASTLGLNAASVGKLLSRAEQAFRKEYVKRYGET
jgi:RNA polymerase sigma-70 factor, ECF subfamily